MVVSLGETNSLADIGESIDLPDSTALFAYEADIFAEHQIGLNLAKAEKTAN
jgi:hypothetical protein